MTKKLNFCKQIMVHFKRDINDKNNSSSGSQMSIQRVHLEKDSSEWFKAVNAEFLS